MTHNRFWWNCKYLETDRNLGVAFCSKTNDFCNKSKCDKIKLKSQKHNQFYRERIKELEKENEQLKSELKNIHDTFEFNWTQNHVEIDKDKLFIKDIHIELFLENNNLFIQVFVPQINEYYRFKYMVTGRSLMREFIENYNPKGDVE